MPIISAPQAGITRILILSRTNRITERTAFYLRGLLPVLGFVHPDPEGWGIILVVGIIPFLAGMAVKSAGQKLSGQRPAVAASRQTGHLGQMERIVG